MDENGNELETEELSTTEQYEAYYDRNNVPVKDVKETETMAYQFNKYVDDNYDEKKIDQNDLLFKLHVGKFVYHDDTENKEINIGERVIQGIHVKDDDIYVTQHSTRGDVLIRHYRKGIFCQGKVEEYDPDGIKTYRYTEQMSDALEMQDYMLLKSVGHGTTLVSYTSPNDGEVYFLVCAGKEKPNDDTNNTTNKIGRIKYRANTVYTGSDIQRMCKTNYATFKGKQPTGYGTLKSVIANISRDEKYVYMRVKWCVGEKSNILHTVYDLKKLDAILASASPMDNNLVSFKDNADAKAACVYSFDQYSSTLPANDVSAGRRNPFSFSVNPTKINILLRYNQGLAITPAGMIYNYTGDEVITNNMRFDMNKGTYPTITRLNVKTKTVKGYKLKFELPDSWFTDDEGVVRRASLENEGMQMVTGHFYIGVSPKDGYGNDTNRRVAYIFDISNSYLSF